VAKDLGCAPFQEIETAWPQCQALTFTSVWAPYFLVGCSGRVIDARFLTYFL
jgi:hypothetical protein